MRKWFKGLTGFFILLILICTVLFGVITHNFDTKIFDSNNVYKNTQELSSAKYKGRLAGSAGNNEALKYIENSFKIMGITPAGEAGTYYQNLKIMLPFYNFTPEFVISDNNGNTQKFKYGMDFREILNGAGGAGSVKGRLCFFDGEIKKIPVETLRSNVMVALGPLSSDDFQYAAENGCKALVFSEVDPAQKADFDMQSKSVKTMIIYEVSKDVLDSLFNAKVDINAELNVDVSFKMQSAPNILGKIEGTDKSAGYLFITSHIDGAGETSGGSFVPGSLHDASGTAMMMELARTLKSQNYRPRKTIVFAAWNGFFEGCKGSKYYADNPLYPLDKSEVIALDGIGSDDSDRLYLSSYGDTGEALMSKLASYIPEKKFNVMTTRNIHGNDTEAFLMKDVPSVLLYGDSKDELKGTEKDSMDRVSKENLNSIGSILLSYMQRDVYKDWVHGFLTSGETAALSILIFVALASYLLKLFYRLNPKGKFLGIGFEKIYYSTIFGLMDKFAQVVLTFAAAVFIIIFIAYIPASFDIVTFNGTYMSNYSTSTIINNAITYMREFTAHGFGKTENNFSILYIISFSIIKSLLLILCSVTLAFIFGTLGGAISGFKRKKNSSIRFLGSIAVLSFPDVFIAILLQLLMAYLAAHNIFVFLLGIDESTRFIIPFIALAIIPTAYISRIAQIAVREEINKEYITAARAKGLSNFRILKDHLLISIIIKVVDSLPSVLNIIISDLIIVETFFAYPGIVYELFSYFKEKDIKTCAGLIMGIGVIYCILILLFKLIAVVINPAKRRDTSKSSVGI